MQTTFQPDSLPFLLTRPPSSVEEIEDGDTNEIPSSRSVPPHAPPPRVTTTEMQLPSVIVDVQHDRDPGDPDGSVDVLLATSVPIPISLPPPAIEVDFRARAVDPFPSAAHRSAPSRARGVVIGLLAAAMLLGGTVTYARVAHRSIGSALHFVR